MKIKRVSYFFSFLILIYFTSFILFIYVSAKRQSAKYSAAAPYKLL